METEKMKAKAGQLYDANYDAELLAERAAGNPCRVIREITEEHKDKYRK